jgi:hypothetical protein
MAARCGMRLTTNWQKQGILEKIPRLIGPVDDRKKEV